MPIYAYRCESCGHAKDVLQKVSDPVLTVCPVCGEATFRKQVTAAGFQLKGSGWYVTDFRGDKPSAKPAESADKAEGGGAGKTNGSAAASTDGGSAAPSKTADAAPGVAASPAPAAPAPSSSGSAPPSPPGKAE